MEDRKLPKKRDAGFGDRQRQDAVEQIAAGLAYGMRNPLTVIKGYLQLYQCNPAYCTQESFCLMLRETEAIETVTSNLITVVRNLAAEKSPQELQLLCSLLPMVSAAVPHRAAVLAHSHRHPLCAANGEALHEASGTPPEQLKKGMLKRQLSWTPLASPAGSGTAARAVCPGGQREESCHGE